MTNVKLWLKLLSQSSRRLLSGRLPLRVADNESLGREIFYSKYIYQDGSGKTKLGAFIPKENEVDISVSQLFAGGLVAMAMIGVRHGHRRSRPCNFYGFGAMLAEEVRQITTVRSTPTLENPFHADIAIPSDDGTSARMNVARRLSDISKFIPSPINET